MTRTQATVRRLLVRRPGPWGTAALPLTWVALGVLVVLYVVGILVLAFAAVVVHTLRLLLGPPLRLLARRPELRALQERRRLARYARDGVDQIEAELRHGRSESASD